MCVDVIGVVVCIDVIFSSLKRDHRWVLTPVNSILLDGAINDSAASLFLLRSTVST